MGLEDEIRSNFRNVWHKAIVNISYTNYFISSQFQEIFKKYKVTRQQYNILRILREQHPKSANIWLIKERMLDKSSDVTRLVERVRMKKLIERRACRKDRRKMDVKITQSGLDLLAKIDTCEQQMDSVLSNLSGKEVRFLNDLLDKLRK